MPQAWQVPVADHRGEEAGYQGGILDATDREHLQREHRTGDGGAEDRTEAGGDARHQEDPDPGRIHPEELAKAAGEASAHLHRSALAPADPPKQVRDDGVRERFSGAIRSGTPPSGSWISSTMRLLPASTLFPNRR